MVNFPRNTTQHLQNLFAAFPVLVVTGAEVDCVIERDGWLHPIEIKLTAQPTRKQTLGLQGFRKAHPDQRIGHGLMLCAVEQPRWISEDVLALPWNLL